jgi:O-antigen ligase
MGGGGFASDAKENHELKLALPTLDSNNKLYFAVTIPLVPLIGSVSSILVWIAFIWALIRLARGDFSLTRIRAVRITAAAFAFFFLVEALSAATSFRDLDTLDEIAGSVIFLAILPIYSRLALSNREEIREVVENAALFGSFATLALALFQLGVLGLRPEGNAGNAIPFATACAVSYGVTFLACLRSTSYRRLAFAIATVAMGASIILSGTRSLWPALVLIPAIIFFIYRGHISDRSSWRLITAAAALVVLVLIGASGFIGLRLEEALHDLRAAASGEFHTSLGQRFVMWQIGVELFTEAPFLGHGPGSETLLMEARSPDGAGFTVSYTHFHNAFIQFAVRDGILGVIAICALLLTPLLTAARARRDELGAYGLAFIASVQCAYFLSGTLGIMFGHDIMDTLFVTSMIVGLFLVSRPDRKAMVSADGSTSVNTGIDPSLSKEGLCAA